MNVNFKLKKCQKYTIKKNIKVFNLIEKLWLMSDWCADRGWKRIYVTFHIHHKPTSNDFQKSLSLSFNNNLGGVQLNTNG